jgi:hypothetical protein
MRYLKRFSQFISVTPKKQVLPLLYVILIIVGLLLSFISLFLPILNLCASPFGSPICASAGMFLIVVSSFPGYLIVGLVEAYTNTTQIPEIVTMLLVGGVSALLYFVIGLLFDRKVFKKISFVNLPIALSITGFCILVLVFLYLLRLSS